ncbi:hypothetical protein DXG01_012739 [Tephrocybe rancida]|nr:hypothetical protein DXG01_012739 [Tephrocybe rancida]
MFAWLNIVTHNVIAGLLQRLPSLNFHLITHSDRPFKLRYIGSASSSLVQCGPPEVTTIRSPPPSLFAVIIGINKYKDVGVPDLCGAVNDADALEEFLSSVVGVPKHRIVNLRDEQATREGMLNALQDLAQNGAICAHDPILIYYAGHGGEASRPNADLDCTSPNGMVQMLIPHDFDFEGSSDARGQGIFDIQLSQILHDIALNKSDNITVIFDCCYPRSEPHNNPNDRTLAVRGIKFPQNYSIPLDFFWSETHRGKSPGLGSHVLLTACKQGQSAMERQRHGAFTSALLKLLKQDGIDKLTYTDIVTHMPDLPLQTPQCKGVNHNRIMFDSKVHSQHLSVYRIHPTPETPNECTLEVGQAHGITKGAEFAVCSDQGMASALGSVITFDVSPFTSRCSIHGDITFALLRPAYAIQTCVGERPDIRLLIEQSEGFLDLFKRLNEEMQRPYADPSKRFFRLVENPFEQPDLVIGTPDGLVQFEVQDPVCSQYGYTHMPFNNIRPDESAYLLSILRSAADFYWHLRNSKKDSSLTENVHIECLQLESSGELTDDLDEIFVPKQDGTNLVIGGLIFIDIDDSALYGYRILNESETPLYVALFYFDISDLSISQYHLSGAFANGKLDSCLPAHGSLTIGFGDSPWMPRSYFLRKNQKIDVGFLRLYAATSYIDFSNIVQDSPFGRYPKLDQVWPKKRVFGEAFTIPVIQRGKSYPD